MYVYFDKLRQKSNFRLRLMDGLMKKDKWKALELFDRCEARSNIAINALEQDYQSVAHILEWDCLQREHNEKRARVE